MQLGTRSNQAMVTVIRVAADIISNLTLHYLPFCLGFLRCSSTVHRKKPLPRRAAVIQVDSLLGFPRAFGLLVNPAEAKARILQKT